MKITNGVIIEINASDLDANGHFYNEEVIEVKSGLFYDMPELKGVSLPNCTTCDNYCFNSNQALTTMRLNKYKLNVKDVDGFCYVVESRRTTKGVTVFTGYNLIRMTDVRIEKNESYVAEKEGFMAHGESLS